MIKNKDGNIYILEGPNKLVQKQENWDINDLEFHNFIWDDIYYNNVSRSTIKNSLNSTIGQEVRQPIDKSQSPIKKDQSISDIPVSSVTQKNPDPVINVKEEEHSPSENSNWSNYKFPLLKRKVLMHCLPAKTITGQDSLYGESWTKVKYGNKFIFPSVVTKNSDLVLEFWTTDPDNKLEDKSILFPFCYEVYNSRTNDYDRVPYDENRWWKILEKKSKDIGWLFTAVPSEDNPDFS